MCWPRVKVVAVVMSSSGWGRGRVWCAPPGVGRSGVSAAGVRRLAGVAVALRVRGGLVGLVVFLVALRVRVGLASVAGVRGVVVFFGVARVGLLLVAAVVVRALLGLVSAAGVGFLVVVRFRAGRAASGARLLWAVAASVSGLLLSSRTAAGVSVAGSAGSAASTSAGSASAGSEVSEGAFGAGVAASVSVGAGSCSQGRWPTYRGLRAMAGSSRSAMAAWMVSPRSPSSPASCSTVW